MNRAKQSVLEEFENFRGRVEPTEAEKSGISASHNKIRDILDNSTEITVVDSFLTGSYARQTMIRPLKDVDFFVQMYYRVHKNDTPLVLLNKIRKVLSKAYPLSPVKVMPPCIRVQFKYCHFEIAPSFGVQGNDNLFLIPNDKGTEWQETYPKIPDNWMTEENKKSEGLFIPTIKMIKRWRDTHHIPIRSFHLEMLTRMAFDNDKIEDYVQGVWAFFARTSYLFGYNYTPFVQEPGRSGVYVDQYLYDNPLTLESVKLKIRQHISYAQKALDFMNKGQIGSAKAYWRIILGSDFHTS